MASRHDVLARTAGRPDEVMRTATESALLSQFLIESYPSSADSIAATVDALIIMVARSGKEAVGVMDAVISSFAEARKVLACRAEPAVSPAVVS